MDFGLKTQVNLSTYVHKGFIPYISSFSCIFIAELKFYLYLNNPERLIKKDSLPKRNNNTDYTLPPINSIVYTNLKDASTATSDISFNCADKCSSAEKVSAPLVN